MVIRKWQWLLVRNGIFSIVRRDYKFEAASSKQSSTKQHQNNHNSFNKTPGLSLLEQKNSWNRQEIQAPFRKTIHKIDSIEEVGKNYKA